MPDIDYVRVKDKSNGYKFTIVRSAAEADPDAFLILKQDAVDHNGLPLPAEYGDSPATSGQKATDNTKES